MKDAERYIRRVKQEHAAGRPNHYAIVSKINGNLIGGINLDIDPDPAWKDEICYWIGKDFWGNGYASEAVADFVAYAFTNQQRRLLWALPDPLHKATCRVLEKAGFVATSLLHREKPSRTGSMQMVRYEMKNPRFSFP